MVFINEVVDSVKKDHADVLKMVENANNFEIIKIDNQSDNVWALKLPEDTEYNRTISGWLYNAVNDEKCGDTKVGHWCDGAFTKMSQLSLTSPYARPLFLAIGDSAEAVLETIKKAFCSFDPESFDSDGYSK